MAQRQNSLPADTPIRQLIDTFVHNPSLRGIFLLDSKQKFCGLITRIDLLRWARLRLYGGKGRHDVPISEYFKLIDAQTVMDIAYKDSRKLAVKENESLKIALDKMLDFEEDVLAVIDNGGRIVGDLRLSEILWWITTSRLIST